jgi:arylsulfatase A-like enzyme
LPNNTCSDLLGSLALGGVLCLASSPAFSAEKPATQPSPSRRPNILLILTDDQGYGDIASYPPDARNRDPYLQTPNMDRLATQGVKFAQGYSICGICSPSRVGLLTGRYPQHIGYYDNWEEQVGAPRDEMFLSECMKQHGYSTACIGKWHMGRRPGYRPLERGFDRFWGIIQGQHDYFVPSIGEPQYGGGMAEGEYPSDQETTVTEMGYFTDELTSRTLEFIDEHAQSRSPFFIYLSYTAPHGPFQAPRDLVDKYDRLAGKRNPQRNRVRAMLDSLDRASERFWPN